jgi:CheY-like chemotaxis protein
LRNSKEVISRGYLMTVPMKPCAGRFGEETNRLLMVNENHAQWLPHDCEQCGQPVMALLIGGHWTPEPHWPSVPRRGNGKSGSTDVQGMQVTMGIQSLQGASDAFPVREHRDDLRGSVAGAPWSGPKRRGKAPGPAVHKHHERETLNLETQKRTRVFVVDDEFTIASTLALILHHLDFDATSFTGPLDALQAAITHAPDVLVSDIAMPDLSGIELAIRVRELVPDCKVILFSGLASTVDVLNTAEANGQNFEVLLKPVHPAALAKRIREITGESVSVDH